MPDMATPQTGDDLGFVPAEPQQSSPAQDDDLGFVPAPKTPVPQPYSMPDGRMIDPETHTGGVPNPHAVAPVPNNATVSAAPPQTMFERARQYVANSGPGEALETYAPGVSRALNLEPTESETARMQRESDTSAFEYHPVQAVKTAAAGFSNLAKGSGQEDGGPSFIPGGYTLPATKAPSDIPTDPDQMAKGASQIMSGAMGAGKPLVVAGVAAAPIKAAIYYGAGILAGKGSAQVAQSMGATPNEVEFFNTAGFFIPGVLTAAAGIEGASIPEEARVIDPVTHEPVPVRGGAVGGKGFGVGHAVTDMGEHIIQARVGPYSGSVRFGRNAPPANGAGPAPAQVGPGEVLPPAPPVDPVAIQQRAQQATIEETAANAQTIDLKAAQVAGLAPPPPPPPAPGQPGSKQAPLPAGMESGQLSQQVVENAGKAIQSVPPQLQPKAVLEATGNLAKWMFGQKTFVGPDGKVVNVDSQKAAQTEAVNLINNEVDRQKGIKEDNEKAQKDALDKQQADAETAASEREQAREEAEKNQPPAPIPDTPQIQAVRAALAKLPSDTPKADVILAARKAAAGAKFMLTYPLAFRLADEHIATRAQQETAASAGITGEKINPDQDPIALGKMATDVQSGKAAFLQVAPGTKFKPDGLTKENGFVYTDVKKAQDPTFNGRYYHPKEIPSKAVKAALNGPSPLAALQQLELDWRASKTLKTPEEENRSVLSESPEETQLGNPAPETKPAETETAPAKAETPASVAETKPAGPAEPLSYADEVKIYGEASKAARARGVDENDPEAWGTAIAEEEARILAERNGEKTVAATEPEAKPAELAPSPTGNAQPQEKQEQNLSPVDWNNDESVVRASLNTKNWTSQNATQWNYQRRTNPTVKAFEAANRAKPDAALLATAKRENPPQVAQPTKMGAVEFNNTNGAGVTTPLKGTEYIFPGFEEYRIAIVKPRGSVAAHNKLGWESFEVSTGRRIYGEPHQNSTEQKTIAGTLQQLKAHGKAKLDAAIEQGLNNPTRKSTVTVDKAALEKTKTEAIEAQKKFAQDVNNPGTPAYSATRLNPATFKPGQKVNVKQPDGTQKPDEVRLVLPNKKVVLKGQRKPVKVEDVSPAEVAIADHQAARKPGKFAQMVIDHGKAAERLTGLMKDPKADPKELAEAAAKVDEYAPEIDKESPGGGPAYAEDFGYKKPTEEHADLAATLYSNPLDPALFKRLIGQPLMKMAEPLRAELAERGRVADVANNVHDALQNLDRTNRATTLEAKGLSRALLKAGFSNEDGKAVFANLEDPVVKLTPKQEELRDEWIKPLNQVTRAQYVVTELIKSGKFKLEDILGGKVPEAEIAKVVPPDEGNYQHRIAVEHDTFVDKLLGDSLKRFRAPGNVLSRIFPSSKRSIFKEAHGPNGEREVVAVKDGRVTQFVSQDNAGILDQQIAEAQKELDAAKGNPQRQIELSNRIEGLQQKADAVKAGGHATLDLGPHISGYVSTAKLADDAVAPLETKLSKLQTEFHTLHGSQSRARASQQRIENLYYQIDGLEKQIAAVRASVGPEQEAEEGLTRQQALEERVKPLQDQIQKLTEKQAELASRETNTRWGERQLKSIPGRIQDLKDRIDALGDEMAGKGLEGKYWRDKNGDLWKFDRGTTDFISNRTGQQYHADARLAGIVNFMETNKAMNAAVVLEQTKALLQKEGMGQEIKNTWDIPEGWKGTSLQQMRGWYFPAHVADAFDQFDYLQQRGAPNVLEMANNFVIQSVLMNPLYHGLNIGSNWFAGKEGEALAGKGISPSFYVDNVKAGIEAANMLKDWGGPEYQRLLRLGLDLRGADTGFDVRTKEILRSFTDQLDQDKESNALIAGLVGVKNAAQFIRKLNHEITFGMGDLALAQSFYAKRAELMRDGVPNAEEAARDWAHRLVGEYTTPVRLLGSAGLGRLAENPIAQSFFRYHFGYILRPLATAVRESLGEFKPDEEASQQAGEEVNEFGQTSAGARRLAIARLIALTAMAVYVFPKLLDQAAKKLTNDERARAPRGGLFKFASDVYETATGERSIGSVLESVFTPGLGLEKLAQLGTNRDFFTGRKIAGSDQDAEGQMKQRVQWLWKGTLPGQQAARMDQSGLRQTVEALLGFKFPIEHGIREAVEIRRDEGGSNPPDPEHVKVFQSMMAAAEQARRTQGKDTSLHDALLESGKLTASEKRTLNEAIREAPIVFAVHGLEKPADYWRVYEHSTDVEKSALLHDHATRHELNVYQKDLRAKGKIGEADEVLDTILASR